MFYTFLVPSASHGPPLGANTVAKHICFATFWLRLRIWHPCRPNIRCIKCSKTHYVLHSSRSKRFAWPTRWLKGAHCAPTPWCRWCRNCSRTYMFYMAHGPRPTVHGPRPRAHGPRSTAHGPRPTAHGPRPMAHGARQALLQYGRRRLLGQRYLRSFNC